MNLTRRYQQAHEPHHQKLQGPHGPRKKQLRILNVNFQSVRRKGSQLEALIDATDPDIIMGTETWLDDSY